MGIVGTFLVVETTKFSIEFYLGNLKRPKSEYNFPLIEPNLKYR